MTNQVEKGAPGIVAGIHCVEASRKAHNKRRQYHGSSNDNFPSVGINEEDYGY